MGSEKNTITAKSSTRAVGAGRRHPEGDKLRQVNGRQFPIPTERSVRLRYTFVAG